jgi:hypothetical protein
MIFPGKEFQAISGHKFSYFFFSSSYYKFVKKKQGAAGLMEEQ